MLHSSMRLCAFSYSGGNSEDAEYLFRYSKELGESRAYYVHERVGPDSHISREGETHRTLLRTFIRALERKEFNMMKEKNRRKHGYSSHS